MTAATPEASLQSSAEFSGRRFLMITHDQEIDRRILQQARSLMQRGWSGTIVCLSHDQHDAAEREELLEIARIGLSKIIPPCPVYKSYQWRQNAVLEWCYTRPHRAINGRWPRMMKLVDVTFRNVSSLHGKFYRAHLYAYYQNRRITCPLPFDDCFYAAAKAWPADLVIAHDLPALPAGVRVAAEWNVPLVYDAHELYYEQKAFSRRQKGMMRRVESELIHKCSATFTVNDSIAEEMARRYGCRKPGVLLNALDPTPEGADIGSPNEGTGLLREHLQLEPDRPLLLFQGGLLANRNLENLVRAMAHVKNQRCLMVFMGNGPLREPLESMAKNMGIAGRMRFVPAVPPSELLAWTRSADLGVIPYPPVDLNTRFCTPNKLFEYIQAGVPILANDLPELRRYVLETAFGQTAPMHNPQAIAVAIDQFIADKEAVRKARETIVRRREEFTWSHVSREYVRIVDSLVPARRSDAGENGGLAH